MSEPIKITLPAARRALRAVAGKLPERTNELNVLVQRAEDAPVDLAIRELSEEHLVPGCLVGVMLVEELGVPMHSLVPHRWADVNDLGTSNVVRFTPAAAALLESAQAFADGRVGPERRWGEIPGLVGA